MASQSEFDAVFAAQSRLRSAIEWEQAALRMLQCARDEVRDATSHLEFLMVMATKGPKYAERMTPEKIERVESGIDESDTTKLQTQSSNR